MALMRVRTVFSGVPGTPWYSNLFFEGGTGLFQDAVDAVAAFWEDCSAAISPLVSWTVEGTVTVLDPVTGQPVGVIAATGDGGPGTASGDMVSRASQILVQLRTGEFLNGREVRGKIFIPGVVGSTVDADGGVETAVVAQFEGYTATLLANSATVPLSVWSRTGGIAYPVVDAPVSSEWAVLRSRRD